MKPHTLEGFLPILHELKEDHLFQCWRFTNDVQTNSSCKMLRHLPSIITKHQEYLRLSTLTAGEFVCFGEWRYPQIRFGHIMMFSFFQHGYFHELVSCTWIFFLDLLVHCLILHHFPQLKNICAMVKTWNMECHAIGMQAD